MKTLISFLPKAAAYFFILLFCYAAVSKLLDYENFQVQLAQSPLLSAYAGTVAWAVIAAELFIVILLAFPATLRAGLYASFGLMVAFTVYIYLILNYSDFVPCSCGGILEKMGWTEHLIFNAAAVLLSIVGIWATHRSGTTAEFQRMRFTRPAIILILIAFFSTAVMIALFLSSEYIIKKENNFTRRFPHHPVLEDKILDLGVNSYYFAGYDAEKVYLGNYTAPLTITEIDTAFKSRKQDKVTLKEDNIAFKSLKIQVLPPFIFISDGTIPVIYRASLATKIAKKISINDVFFNTIKPLDSNSLVFRAPSRQNKTQFIGKITVGRKAAIKFNKTIIRAQDHGLFDTDGKLMVSEHGQKLIYVYYYRNQFVVFDKNLEDLSHFKTIDTISKAAIDVQQLKNGTYKMARPPLIVNGEMTATGNVLFVKSNLMGRHESRKMWKNSSVIDMYNIEEGGYIGSFYLKNRGKDKGTQLLGTPEYLYEISGKEMVRYRYAQFVLNHLKREKPKTLKTESRH
ncbi:DoxX family protein [Chryseobacterium lacus]|uniref:DoxX family protein n=1 Tax=Chryseobacterium lacus TaxID=2058346 RepID=UPI000F875589|nr:MauE/DoxX family redox-associated membrane protein [Chryseobacterium lacus]RST26226.1 tellurium resistance protein TerC [Chryseobacterium lacus]